MRNKIATKFNYSLIVNVSAIIIQLEHYIVSHIEWHIFFIFKEKSVISLSSYFISISLYFIFFITSIMNTKV